MLKYFEVVGLNDKTDVRIDFNRNLTILTGRNGSGKTTVLKLLWYLVSRNIERIPREMAFRSITLRGDNFGITVESAKKAGRYRFYWHVGSDFHDNEIVMEHIQDERPVVYKANVAIAEQNSTIFFPTFRRLEGGFSLATSRVRARQAIGDSWATTEQSNLNEVSRLLSSISSRLAAHPHIFVSTVSTLDVELLLTNRYASIAKQTNVLHDSLIKHIFNLVEQENDFKVGDTRALDEVTRWFAFVVNQVRSGSHWKLGTAWEVLDPSFRLCPNYCSAINYVSPSDDDVRAIRDNYQHFLRGKTWLEVLTRLLGEGRRTGAKFSSASLRELGCKFWAKEFMERQTAVVRAALT